jgi:four helix bundle protein
MQTPRFDHEKLDVYRLSIEFVSWVGEAFDEGPLKGCRLAAAKQLDRASTSIALNIAEGNGKRSKADRCRFLEISRGSALECAACLDVFVARGRMVQTAAEVAKAMLVRIVSMLSKLIHAIAG